MITQPWQQEPKASSLRDDGDQAGPSKTVTGALPAMTIPLDRRGSVAKRWWVRGFWLVSLAVAYFGGQLMVRHQHGESKKISLTEERASSTQPVGPLVSVTPVSLRTIRRTVTAVGTLHGFEELTLSSKMEGRVAKVFHELADIVRPGDVLLELDPTDAKLAVIQAERALEAELARWGFKEIPEESTDLTTLPGVVSAKLKFDLANARFERFSALRLSNAISADEFEQARSEKQVSESEWRNQLLLAEAAAATARLRQSELSIDQQRLEDCRIRVPEPSLRDRESAAFYTISERIVSEGSHVRVGSELFRLVFGRTLKLRLAVPEVHSQHIDEGQTVEIWTKASNRQHAGTVTRISPAIDRATRTLLVEVQIPNEDGELKPGGFAKAEIITGMNEQATTVPLSAIYSFAGIQKLFVESEGVVREHHVELGEQTGDWVEIAKPLLPPDSRVVTSGQRLLSDGLPIVVARSDPPASAEGGSQASKELQEPEVRR